MSDNGIVQTEWGYEIVWADTEFYSGKILVFEKSGKRMPLHFHKSKSKSWFVNAGKFKVQWVDTSDGKVYAQELSEGSVFHVPELMPAMLESLADNSAMAEVSNSNNKEDFFRLN
jgi:quercetin dioxygenase-like cupin family protein